jgi:hypothetical protein
MKFKVELEQIKTRELIALETSLSAGVKLMSRFMVDASGEPIPEDKASELLMELNAVELNEAVSTFTESILPKVKGGRS